MAHDIQTEMYERQYVTELPGLFPKFPTLDLETRLSWLHIHASLLLL